MKETITRSYLESLSTSELLKISDDYGIDIPDDLERIFIIEEILECTKPEEQEKKEEIKINPSYADTVELPKQYNLSFIDIYIRDPLWIFANWEIKEQDKESFEKSPDFNGYFLKIIPLDENNLPLSKENAFSIPLDSSNDNSRYIGFTEHAAHSASDAGNSQNRYIIKLGAMRGLSDGGDAEHQIAVSQVFYLPRLVTNKNIQTLKESPLARLSGIDDLPVIIDWSSADGACKEQ